MLPDVNVLVAAHHSSHPHHRIAADWLQGTLTSANGQVMRLPMATIASLRTPSPPFANSSEKTWLLALRLVALVPM